MGQEITTFGWSSTDTFSKTMYYPTGTIDWGLYRTRIATNLANWGDTTPALPNIATLINDASGKNVDVVVIDGGICNPNTLEFMSNPDGTGYTRRVEFDWNKYQLELEGVDPAGKPYQYAYQSTSAGLNNPYNGHQSHTTGTTAGNTQGYARDANIYNRYFSGSKMFQFVKKFHLDKKINPVTGVKNPTITNNSWGSVSTSYTYSYQYLQRTRKIVYRGNTYTPISGDPQAGTAIWPTTIYADVNFPMKYSRLAGQNTSTAADILDAAAAGVINVVSAGNSYQYCDVPGGVDYNNYIEFYSVLNTGWFSYFYHRGSSPGSAYSLTNPEYNPICVGSLGATHTGAIDDSTSSAEAYRFAGYLQYKTLLSGDYKSEFSNYGPRIDVYAPGACTLSVQPGANYATGSITDPRCAILGDLDTSSNTLNRNVGTSMAGPHVAGIIACLLEKYPRMTQGDVRKWLLNSPHAMLTTSGGSLDATDLGKTSSTASNDQIVYLKNSRAKDASIGGYYNAPFPNNISSYRSSSGGTYPRPNHKRVSGRLNATFSLSSLVKHLSSANYTDTSLNLTPGDKVRLILTTTNLDNGTYVPFSISGKRTTSLSTTYYDFYQATKSVATGAYIYGDYFIVNNNTATYDIEITDFLSFCTVAAATFRLDVRIPIVSPGILNYLRFTVN